MTKPFDAHRGEIVRLYIDENKTLELVMDLMRARHCFAASYVCLLSLGNLSPFRPLRPSLVRTGASGDAAMREGRGDGWPVFFREQSVSATGRESETRRGAARLTRAASRRSRRSYMDNLKKWGVRKYKRRAVADDDRDAGRGAGDGRNACEASSAGAACATAPDGAASPAAAPPLVLPYQRDHGHTPVQPPGVAAAASAYYPLQGVSGNQDALEYAALNGGSWDYFADSSWQAEEVSLLREAAHYRVVNAVQ